MRSQSLLVLAAALGTVSGYAGVITYGDMDCLGQGCYGVSNPTAGATLQGLAPGAITFASTIFAHTFPFTPNAGDFPGTDTMFVGSTQTSVGDGYSGSVGRVNGPQVLTLDYSSLVGSGQSLSTLTLGIATDDFQFPSFGQPYQATVNGVLHAGLTAQLNALSEGGPRVQFLTIGLDPTIDKGSHILTLSINEGGNGSDGWAVDFLTVGATTSAVDTVPEPSTIATLTLGLAGFVAAVARRLSK